jgi:hypothetical protein
MIGAMNNRAELPGGVEQIARDACQSCHNMTVEMGAAMDRIEVLIVERDAARALANEYAERIAWIASGRSERPA